MTSRYIKAQGSPASIKKTWKDFPKARIVEIDIENGWMIVKWDKHNLIKKLANQFNLKLKSINWESN
mgnify:CR=1 FL=1|tara:strand:+ start:239 stop:439 length:201 start_codon:yes stop_codon:yes gene_type:complete